MALIYSGDSTFKQSGPPQWTKSTWDLDQLVVPWRGGMELLDAFLNSLVIGSSLVGGDGFGADGGMFLVNWSPDDHRQFPTVRIIYQGRKNGILPPQRHESLDSVMSSTSSRFSSGLILASPLTIEYYAPTNVLTYISANGEGSDAASDPAGTPVIISATCNDQTFSITPPISATVNQMFTPQVLETFQSTEIVPSKYWKNVSKKIKSYSPWIFSVSAGPYLSLYNPGSNYQIGDVLTIGGTGGSASVQVTEVFAAFGQPGVGGVYRWTVTGNTFTASQNALPAHGGSGTGCAFNVFVI